MNGLGKEVPSYSLAAPFLLLLIQSLLPQRLRVDKFFRKVNKERIVSVPVQSNILFYLETDLISLRVNFRWKVSLFFL